MAEKRIDEYQWSALYEDGSILEQYESDGTEHGFAEIDLKRLAGFKVNTGNPILPTEVAVVVDQSRHIRPVYFYRRMITANLGGGQPEQTNICVIGLQKTIEGRNFKMMAFIFPDGSIILTDDESVVS